MTAGPKDRVSSNGILHFAMAYHRAAVILALDRTKPPFRDVPIVYLLRHAIEMYLKAYLRHRGESVADLKGRYSHRLQKALDACSTAGMPVTDSVAFCVKLLDAAGSSERFRYFESGMMQQPTITTLHRACSQLRDHVHAVLAADGVEVHRLDRYFGDQDTQIADALRMFFGERAAGDEGPEGDTLANNVP